jgi:tRNA A-37 threonylcarbamoyl transferase component Bud32
LEAVIALSAGDRLGPYEIVAALGSGGMGAVFRARDTRLRREVALKIIHPSLLKPEYVERFGREARAAAALNHPNILSVFDVNIDAPTPYVVSELLEGESLRTRLDRSGALSYRKALDYGIQVAHALAAAHAKGIYHRDVKPANIFITVEGRVKLLDFGLAKLRSSGPAADSDELTAPDLSGHGRAIGTVGYMAPEQVVGGAVDHRTDIFALGAVLYEMFTKVRAFQRSSAGETMNAVLKEEPDDLLLRNPSLPPAAATAVRRCLEKNPEERFQSARDLAFHLQQVLQATTGSHPILPPLTPTGRLLATVLLALAAAGALLYWLTPRPESGLAFQQLTYHRGRIGGARFAGPDVVYSQSLGPHPEVSLRIAGSPEARRLDYEEADVLATRAGELALSLHRRFLGGERFVGTLALAPLGGGAPHEILEDVEDADSEAGGSALVVARTKGFGTGSELEYPIGRSIYRTAGSIQSPRLSRDGRQVAFLEDPAGLGTAGQIVVLDHDGRTVVRTRNWTRARGLAWSASGAEVWFTAAEGRGNRALRAVDLAARERLVYEAPASLTIWDVAADGRVLLTREDERMAVVGVPPGEVAERDLSWFDTAGLAALSADGRTLLFGDRFGMYVRPTNGSPAVKLGAAFGYPDDLSPDGSLILATSLSTDQLSVIPARAGQPRRVVVEGLLSFSGSQWFPDGRRILTNARAKDHGPRSYVFDVAGGTPRAVTEEGVWGLCISPTGDQLAAIAPGRGISLVPVEGGPARDVPGSLPGDRPVRFASDGRSLWVFRRGEIPTPVYRVEIETGRRQLWKSLVPPDAAGVSSVDEFKVTPSGHAYFYSYRRTLSELYEVRGLR